MVCFFTHGDEPTDGHAASGSEGGGMFIGNCLQGLDVEIIEMTV